MEENLDKVYLQTIKKKYSKDDRYTRSFVYYGILDVLNGLDLSKREKQLLAYTSVRGTISSVQAKNEFVKLYGSSVAAINNMVSRLYKKNLLKKSNNRIEVNRAIVPNSKVSEIVLNINLLLDEG